MSDPDERRLHETNGLKSRDADTAHSRAKVTRGLRKERQRLLTPTCPPDGGVRGLTGAGRNRQMADQGEGVPAKIAMNALATGQFPFRLNEPLAPFCATPQDLHEPRADRTPA